MDTRTPDSRMNLHGFFLDPCPEPEVFLPDELPEAIERASELPGITLLKAEYLHADSGDRTVRTVCKVSGQYEFTLNQ